MTAARASRQVVEVLVEVDPLARVSRQVVEVLYDETVYVELTATVPQPTADFSVIIPVEVQLAAVVPPPVAAFDVFTPSTESQLTATVPPPTMDMQLGNGGVTMAAEVRRPVTGVLLTQLSRTQVLLDLGPEWYLPFSEASGTTAADLTGNGHDGTVVQAGAWGEAGMVATDPNDKSLGFCHPATLTTSVGVPWDGVPEEFTVVLRLTQGQIITQAIGRAGVFYVRWGDSGNANFARVIAGWGDYVGGVGQIGTPATEDLGVSPGNPVTSVVVRFTRTSVTINVPGPTPVHNPSTVATVDDADLTLTSDFQIGGTVSTGLSTTRYAGSMTEAIYYERALTDAEVLSSFRLLTSLMEFVSTGVGAKVVVTGAFDLLPEALTQVDAFVRRPVAAFAVEPLTTFVLAGTVARPTASFTVMGSPTAVMDATVPRPATAVQLEVAPDTQLTATIPPPVVDFQAQVEVQATVTATVPRPTADVQITLLREVVVAAVVRRPTATFTLTNDRGLALTATVDPPDMSFTLAPEAQVSLAVEVPRPTAAITLAFPPQTVRTNRVGGRSRSGIGVAVWDPPVVPLPPELDAGDTHVYAQAFSVPTIVGAMPRYSVDMKWRRRLLDRIVVGNTDVTYFRGVPTPFPGYGLTEPLMYGPTAITFPQIASAFEIAGEGALSWLDVGKQVLFQRVDRDTGAVVIEDYVGVVVGFDADGPSMVANVGGEAMGRAALVNRQVPIWTSVQDIGRYAYSAFKDLGLRLIPYLGPTTGVKLQRFGGQSVLDYISELVARSWNREGNRWTIMPAPFYSRGVYSMARKDTTTIHATAYVDDARVRPSLHRDAAEEPNRIYGTGVTPGGMRVRNGVYPGLRQSPPAPYPFNDGRAFGVGTTNTDTDTGDGITVMIQRLIVVKYLDQEDTPGGYDNGVRRAIMRLQSDAGIEQAPLFTSEGPAFYEAAYQHNKRYAVDPEDPDRPYQTELTDPQEDDFEDWVNGNDIPFDLNADIVDYDMRGFWLNEHPGTWHEGDHFPDTYKTPYDTTFSAESVYATADCPFHWRGDNLMDTRSGRIIFGESAPNGRMNVATWDALYDLDVTGYSLRWSHIEPMAQHSYVREWNRSGSGAIMGHNPRYRPAALVVDRNIDFGSGYTSDQMGEWSTAELGEADEKNWTGSLSITLGALIRGEHNPGDDWTDDDVLDARDLRPGQNLWLPLFDGGTLVHIAAVNVGADGTVSVDVDTKARDAMEVWEVIARNRDSRNSPARAWRADHRSSTMTKDSMGIWDEVGGLLGDPVTVQANTWVVFPVVAGQEGTVRSLRVRTSPAAEYVMAVFGDAIYASRLTRLVGNPLTHDGKLKWADQDVRDELDQVNLLLYVAGDKQEPLGYFPNTKHVEDDPDTTTEESGTNPLTGRWEDDASFSYHTGQHPVLYVAVFTDRTTTIPRGRLMWNQLEAGV